MSGIILFCAIVIFFCIVTNKFSSKMGMPALLLFMLLGILFGEDGILKLSFDNYDLTAKLCTIALLFIIFYGGFCTKTIKDKMLNIQAGVLSSLGTVLTALITAAFCYWGLKMDFAESFLIGAILSSTDAASVFSILRSRKLNLKYNSASLLEIESGSNDPFAYMLTVLGIIILKGAQMGSIVPMFIAQIGYGVIFGILVALFGIFVFKKTKLIQEGSDTLFVVALALASYAIPDLIGGNGYLSVYITGIILGNSEIKNKINLIYFFDGVTALSQIIIFFLLGFLSTPSRIGEILVPGLLIVLFLSFVARPIAVGAIMLPFRAKLNQIAFVSMAGLRGAASIVFAIFAVAQATDLKYDLFHIVFFVSFISVAFQGSMLPWFAHKFNMIDEYSDVLKTFNDYQNESAITLSKTFITSEHPWCNKKLKEIKLDSKSLVLVIQRDGCKVAPKGDTQILENDMVLIGTTVTHSNSDIKLKEMEITKNHQWKNKYIKDIDFQDGFLIALIKRGGNSFVPNGDTKIIADDTIVFYNI